MTALAALGPAGIAALIPHQGAMCLLACVRAFEPGRIICTARSHLDPANPLREGGRLGIICGAEYALQAAALHGALLAGAAARRGMLVSLSDIAFHAARLDDPAIGTLLVDVAPEPASQQGMRCRFSLRGELGQPLLEGQGAILYRE